MDVWLAQRLAQLILIANLHTWLLPLAAAVGLPVGLWSLPLNWQALLQVCHRHKSSLFPMLACLPGSRLQVEASTELN